MKDGESSKKNTTNEFKDAVTVKTVQLRISLDCPRIVKTYPDAIQTVLSDYVQYSNVVVAHSKQLTTTYADAVTTETARSVDTKFCIDVEYP